jgi:hypothetical protein
MSLHIVSHDSLKRPGYVYDSNGVGAPAGLQPCVNWRHIDGPLLYTSDGGLHWLTLFERVRLSLGLTNIAAIDRKRRRP